MLDFNHTSSISNPYGKARKHAIVLEGGTGKDRSMTIESHPARNDSTDWKEWALQQLEREQKSVPETPLREFFLPDEWGISLLFKDESAQPSGSLKHRLARALVRGGVAVGRIGPDSTLVEATSGSTAISELFFANLLGLKFVAVVHAATSEKKLDLIRQGGGEVVLVERAGDVYRVADELGAQENWHNLDQFGEAARVYCQQGNDSLARSVFERLASEGYAAPTYFVVGAGTGGTSAMIGTYLRRAGSGCEVVVVDPEGSAFYDAWRTGSREITASGSRIEGIGRPRVEPSFCPEVISEVIRVPDRVSLAAMDLLMVEAGIRAGGSTGTNAAGAFEVISRMRRSGQTGVVVSIICDHRDRYDQTSASLDWRRRQRLRVNESYATMAAFVRGESDVPF